MKTLRTPVGSPEFIHALAMERLDEERQLWEATEWVPDLQCALQILVQCAGPRCHHFVRTVPLPVSSRAFAEGPAYWASADSLQMIAQRLPTVAAKVLGEPWRRSGGGRLFGRAGGGNAQVGSRRIREQTRVDGPLRPRTTSASAVFRTWRMAARLAIPHIFLFRTPLPGERGTCSVVCRGPGSLTLPLRTGASSVLLGCPSRCEFQIQPETFRVLIWRDCAFRSMSQTPSVDAVHLSTTWAVTEGRAPIHVV